MTARLTIVALMTLVAAGCGDTDLLVSPTMAPADRLGAQTAPFRNYGDSVSETREQECVVTWGCCSNPRPHRHCR